MTKAGRPLLLVLLFAFLALMLGGCVLPQERKAPPELMQDQVLVHDLALQKTSQSVKSVGWISDLFYDQVSHDLVVAGTAGVAHVSDGGTIGVSFKFNDNNDNIAVVPYHGKFRFLNRGGWASPGCLYDPNGTKLWTAKARSGVDDIAYGAFGDAGEKARFVVGYNGDGGVSLLDDSGTELWNKEDGNVWHVEVIAEKSHPALIVHSNAGGDLTTRDEAGNVLKTSHLPFYFAEFSLCTNPKSRDEKLLVSYEGGFIWLCSSKGEVVSQFSAPIVFEFGKVKAVPVRFSAGETYLASVVAWERTGRSVLYVHDDKGHLVYEETFDNEHPALTVLPGQKTVPDTLIVGGKDKIWKYKF